MLRRRHLKQFNDGEGRKDHQTADRHQENRKDPASPRLTQAQDNVKKALLALREKMRRHSRDSRVKASLTTK